MPNKTDAAYAVNPEPTIVTYNQSLDEEEMSDTPFTLFYAWQSDTPSVTGRNFVEDAATKALKRIDASGVLGLAPRLDKDTKDVSGTPDIANTILDKIRTSSAILADLSFIGKGSLRPKSEPKLLPNPNVLLELGYAIAHLGWERVICVINTHYGEKEDLPFDLRHRRWPLSYCLPPDADQETLNTAKQQLSKELEIAIKAQARVVLEQFATTRQISLSDLQADYLLTLSKPRNNGSIPSAIIDAGTGREVAPYQEAIELFQEWNLMQYDGSSYKLTTKGWLLADQLWGLKILDVLEINKFIEDKTLAEAVGLTDGQTELEELRRLVTILKEQGLVSVTKTRGGWHIKILEKGVTYRKHRPLEL